MTRGVPSIHAKVTVRDRPQPLSALRSISAMCHDFSAKASVTLNFLKRSKRTRKKRVLRAEPEFQYEHLGRGWPRSRSSLSEHQDVSFSNIHSFNQMCRSNQCGYEDIQPSAVLDQLPPPIGNLQKISIFKDEGDSEVRNGTPSAANFHLR